MLYVILLSVVNVCKTRPKVKWLVTALGMPRRAIDPGRKMKNYFSGDFQLIVPSILVPSS